MQLFLLKFGRRGLSSIVGGIIITSLAVLILGTLFVVGLQSTRSVQEANLLANKIQTELKLTTILASENVTGSTRYLTLKNVGPVRAYIKWLIVNIDNSKVALDLYGFVKDAVALNNLGVYLVGYSGLSNMSVGNNDGVLILEPGGYMVLKLPYDFIPREIITAEGKIVNLRYALSNTTVAQTAASVIVWPINLASVLGGILNNESSNVVTVNSNEIQQPTTSSLGVGMKRGSDKAQMYYMVLAYQFTNVTINLYGYSSSWTWRGRSLRVTGFHFGNAYIGLDPEWTKARIGSPKYTVVLTPYDPGGCSYCNILNVTFPNGTTLQFRMDSDFPYGWRLIINGFRPENSSSIRLRYLQTYYGIDVNATGVNTLGLWWLYGKTMADEAWIRMIGHADKILIYKDVPGDLEFSYRPFFFTMDVDNDGIPEFVFATEDVNYGDQHTCNDWLYGVYGGVQSYDDWSVKPFWINITGPAYEIPGKQYAMVTVTIRVYFHDNLGGDVDEVDHADRVIFGVYLVDSSGKIVNSREYEYQELMNLEDTYPPNRNFFVMTVPLLVPDINDTYHIAIMFQDPYDDCYHTDFTAATYMDDGDFILAIEWLGLTFYARG